MPTFDWDPPKSEQNARKHGVRFEEAQTIFFDSYVQIGYDDRHSANEDRFVAIGRSAHGRCLVVVHVYREEEVIRLISARKATRHEQDRYED